MTPMEQFFPVKSNLPYPKQVNHTLYPIFEFALSLDSDRVEGNRHEPHCAQLMP